VSRFFLSYRRNDETSRFLVAKLQSSLERQGHRVFVDLTIKLGAMWREVLQTEIDACDVFVLFLSEGAVSSKEVLAEVDCALTRSRGRPFIIPVRVKYDGSIGKTLERALSGIQQFDWHSDADTELLIFEITKAVPAIHTQTLPLIPKKRSSGLVRWSLYALAGLFGLFLASFLTTFLYRRSQTRALEAKAAVKLAGATLNDLDEGLALAADAAKISGHVLSDAMKAYDDHHYDLLVGTLRSHDQRWGKALSVATNNAELLIADGNQVWRCESQDPPFVCSAKTFANRTFLASVIRGDGEIVTSESPDGKVMVWDSGSVDRGTDAQMQGVTDIRSLKGSLAYALDVPPYLIYEDNHVQSSPPALVYPVQMVAFGPCESCITFLSRGYVFTWHRITNHVDFYEDSTGSVAIAGTTNGDRIAVASRTGVITVGHRPFPKRAGSALLSLSSMALSPDGKWVVLVTMDGSVTAMKDDGLIKEVVTDLRDPSTRVAGFAGPFLITRTSSFVKLWNLDLPERENTVPVKGWGEWRQKLGFAPSGASHNWWESNIFDVRRF